MSEPNDSSVNLQGRLVLIMSDSDMAAAAQQLMQLSDEENNSNSRSSSSSSNSNSNSNGVVVMNMKENNKKGIKAKKRSLSFEEEITSAAAKIEEIFGKEEEVLRPIKIKRRYRFLDSIYKQTKPLKVSYAKNLWY